MIRLRVPWLIALSFALSFAVSPVAASTRDATGDAAAVRAAWGFDRSDLAPHPGVRFGVLPNGMRYALMRTATGTGLSARLHIDAGSAVEGAREGGAMHLIEHLVFGGSANLPRGALLLMLPSQGLARFSDFNAYTTFDETVYRLDLSRGTTAARDTALTLMREVASNLVFTRRAVDLARRDVAAEIGARDAVGDRITTAQNAFFTPEAPIARGSVAGERAGIAQVRAKTLRRLYADHYVPANATLVLVGDFDPVAAEAAIAARFANWQGVAGADPVAGPAPAFVPQPGTRARGFVDPGAPTVVTIAVVKPLGGPDAGAGRDAAFLEHLAVGMFNRRLAMPAGGADPAFARADIAIYDHFSTARLVRIELDATGRDWRRALQAGAGALSQALVAGFTQAELDVELASAARALTAAAGPRSRSALADALVDAAARGIVFTAPADPTASLAYLARVRLADVDRAFAAAWAGPEAGGARSIFVSHDRAIVGDDAAILDAWTGAANC